MEKYEAYKNTHLLSHSSGSEIGHYMSQGISTQGSQNRNHGVSWAGILSGGSGRTSQLIQVVGRIQFSASIELA